MQKLSRTQALARAAAQHGPLFSWARDQWRYTYTVDGRRWYESNVHNYCVARKQRARSIAESALCLLGYSLPYLEDYTGSPAEIVREYMRRYPLAEQPTRQDIADAADEYRQFFQDCASAAGIPDARIDADHDRRIILEAIRDAELCWMHHGIKRGEE